MKDHTIYRFRLKEMTIPRIINALRLRLYNLPDWFLWEFGKEAKQNKANLQKFHNIHVGQRCFIMGNGPSLATMDLSPLANEFTFGLNRIYLLFDKMGFTPTYFVSASDLVMRQFADEIKELPIPKFLNWQCRHIYSDVKDVYFFRAVTRLKVFFEKNVLKPLESGSTVTNVAIQLAFYMGFKEVILIGVDHSFVEKGTPNSVETRKADKDQSHFHPEYFPKGIKWQLPDLLHAEIAYAEARKNYEQEGRRILDATINGKCSVFEKVNYDSLFET